MTTRRKYTLTIGSNAKDYSRRIDAVARYQSEAKRDPTAVLTLTAPNGALVLSRNVATPVMPPEAPVVPDMTDDTEAEFETVCIEQPVTETDRVAMVAAAQREWQAIKEWRANGQQGDAPAAPNLDRLNALNAAYGSASAAKVALKKITGGKAKAERKPAGTNSKGLGELKPGGLAALVAEALAGAGTCTVGQIAKGLDRSAGAVRNALDRMVATDKAILVTESPRTYQAKG